MKNHVVGCACRKELKEPRDNVSNKQALTKFSQELCLKGTVLLDRLQFTKFHVRNKEDIRMEKHFDFEIFFTFML